MTEPQRAAAAHTGEPQALAKSQAQAQAQTQAQAPMLAQCAPSVLMVRPAQFGFNPQTAHSNRFQRAALEAETEAEAETETGAGASSARALAEFAALQGALAAAGVSTCVVDDTPEPAKPDAVFPNNWVSFHEDGTVVLYPMQARNRRLERRRQILVAVERELPFRCRELLDLTAHESQGRYLEGTGSLVLDHVARVAYACRSARTDESLVHEWVRAMRYQAEVFDAVGRDGTPLYHTNVMLAIGSRVAVICSEALAANDRERVCARLAASGRERVEISMAAMYSFAGNLLEVRTGTGAAGTRSLLVMSARARAAFDSEQWARFKVAVDGVIEVAIPTIETLGGGGVRCMLAEVPDSRL